LSLLLPPLAADERQVLARRNDLVAYMLSCSDGEAELEVVSPEGAVFADHRAGDLGTLLRSLKIILPPACPNLQRVTVRGIAQGQVWFAGATRIEDDWRFVSLYAAP